MVLPYVCALKQHCESHIDKENSDDDDYDDEDDGVASGRIIDYSEALKKLKENILSEIVSRFPNDPTLILACSLDPRFMKFSGRYQSVEEFISGIKMFLTNIKDDINLYDKEISTHSTSNVGEMEKLMGNILDDDENDDFGCSVLSKELTMFMKQNRIPSHELNNFNLLTWWKTNQTLYPTLAKVARKIHCIPATSAESEHVFSKAGNVISEKRSRTSPSNLDLFIFIHGNIYEDPEKAIGPCDESEEEVESPIV